MCSLGISRKKSSIILYLYATIQNAGRKVDDSIVSLFMGGVVDVEKAQKLMSIDEEV